MSTRIFIDDLDELRDLSCLAGISVAAEVRKAAFRRQIILGEEQPEC